MQYKIIGRIGDDSSKDGKVLRSVEVIVIVIERDRERARERDRS